MTDNEKLIEAKAKLAQHAMRRDLGAMPKHIRTVLDALAVFEKAHTPTDDEREALIDALLDELGWEWDEVPEEHIPSSRSILGDMADRVLAVTAGFRRSEAPEPSADEPECFAEKPEWPEHWTTNDKLRDLHARWHEQKGNLIGREECGYERCEFWDAAEFTLRLADVHIAGREPQGKASDARRAPLQAVRGVGPKGTISWEEHLEVWNAYAARHGDRQSAERIAERGGFGHSEVRLLLGREPRTFRAGGVR